MNDPLVSIVINNFNYARYLPTAIGSALDQTYPDVEVIVVDDGSTDNSAQVIHKWSDQIQIICKSNGGQPSALNAGFAASRGELVIFLDADDVLQITAAESTVHAFTVGTSKVHWRLFDIDGNGNLTGNITPRYELPDGNLQLAYAQSGPEALPFPPTSGNAWSRAFLTEVFPLPTLEEMRTAGSDKYLSALAPMFGAVRSIRSPQACYRIHGGNNYATMALEKKLDQQLWLYDYCCVALAHQCLRFGFKADIDRWKNGSWIHRRQTTRTELERVIPSAHQYVLVDGGDLGPGIVPGRTSVPLIQHNGQDWGSPQDSCTAITELRRRRSEGATFIVFAWAAFWWLDHYTSLRQYLEERFRCVLRNDRIIVFDLRE